MTRTARLLADRTVQITLVGWLAVNAMVLLLVDGGTTPGVPGAVTPTQILVGADINAVMVLILIAVVHRITRHRQVPDLAARAPRRDTARREVIGLVGYGVLAQLVGAVLGTATGDHPISFHLAGTLYGHTHVTPAEAYLWAAYNVVAYVLLPFGYFRRRYSAEALGLRSSDRRNDLMVIVAVLLIEALVELAGVSPAIFGLTPGQLLAGVPLAFALYFVGTVLPTMIFIYAVLLPRVLRLTGSVPATVMLGGVAYAAVHLFEAWADFTSPAAAVMSVCLILLQYVGPGMVKSVITLRTGNAWVHVWAYHAVSPHVLVDTPHIVQIFKLG